MQLENEQLQRRITSLLVEVARLQRQLFGPKAERVHNAQAQGSFLDLLSQLELLNTGDNDAGERAEALVDELHDELDAAGDEPAEGKPSKKKPSKKSTPHGRRKLDEIDMPTERIVLEPLERTSEGGEALVRIGEDVTHVIDHRPSSLVRIEIVRPKYKLPAVVAPCAEHDDVAPVATIVIAEPPSLPIPKSMAGPGLLAHVIVQKYGDHLPLHRQERIFKRNGVAFARSTLCGFVQGACALLVVLVEAMWKEMKASAPLIMTDACRVLIRADKRCRAAHFQVFVAPKMHVVFRYLDENTGVAVADMLKDFAGLLQCDASSIYHELFRRARDVVEVGCWAHARRNFYEALTVDRPRALIGIGLIGELYDAQTASKNEHGVVDGARRRELATPILARIEAWVARERSHLEAPSKIEVSMGYLQRHWTALTRFVDDGGLRLDNNLSELELRHEVVGRKNWLFCATTGGANWNAISVSLIASCRLHDVEPWAYLRDVLTLLPSWNQLNVLDLAPNRWLETREKPEVRERLKKLQLLPVGVDIDHEADATP